MVTKINHLNEIKLKKGERIQVVNHKRNCDMIFEGILISNKRIKKSEIWNLEILVESQKIISFENVNINAFKYAEIKIL